MTDKIEFNDSGDLILPGKKLSSLADSSPEQIRLLNLSGDVLLSSSVQPGDRKHPILYGDLRLFHVAELLALISSMSKEGILTLLVPHARKVIYFKQGNVVHAASSVEDDRLIEVLWRKGIITLAQLGKVSEQVRPGKRVGKLLIEKGIITPRQLYEGLQEQILEIIYSTFYFTKGEFIFEEGKLGKKYLAPPELTIRELIQRGLSRLDELYRLDNTFADRNIILYVRPLHLDVQMDEHEQYIKSLVNSKRTVEQIIQTSRMGELETLRILSRLLNTGQLDIAKPSTANVTIGDDPVDFFMEHAARIKTIYSFLKDFDHKAVDRLNAYLSIPAKKYKKVFKNVELDDEGRLDIKTIKENIKRFEIEEQSALAAMAAFYDYAKFQAMDVLDDEHCDELLDQLEDS